MKIKLLLQLFWTGLFLPFNFYHALAQAPPKPNVILVNVDDLGWKDVGYMDSSYYETPNLDRLAAQSVVFSQAYAGASNCAPSRASMLTGRYPMTHHIYTVATSERGDAATRKLIPIPNTEHLPTDSYLLSQLFKDEGYVTGIFGKWHISEDPTDFAFDVNVGGGPEGNPGRKGFFSPYKLTNISSGEDGEYLTDRLTEEAIRFAEQNREQPFFLYLPFYTVHTPLMAKEKLKAKFERKTGKPGRDNATYAAMIYSMDENVGKLMAAIDSLGLDENTILIFTSDNGGIRATSYQDPLRAGKGSYYEGGIRVPFFVRWPGHFGARREDFPILHMDIFPTIVDLLDAEVPPLDGVSILPMLAGGEIESRDLYWHFPIYLEAYNPLLDQSRDVLFRTRPGSVVRSGHWKLHHYFEDDGYELYNLAADPGEQVNLADSLPTTLQKLKSKLEAWRKTTGAPIPRQANPTYNVEEELRLSKIAVQHP